MKLALAASLVAVVIHMFYAAGSWRHRDPSLAAGELANVSTCLREVDALFPNQVQAVVFEPSGPRLELAERADAHTYLRFAGSGFRDFTRIAGSHPEMWRDIALANRDALLEELDTYIDKLEAIRGLIEARDGQSLENLFARARQARHNWIEGTLT